MRELIVDNFAGGGGASLGIMWATGRPVDIAINHDPAAIAMYKANFPDTKVYCENIWEVDPVEATQGRPVALAWFSPDCTHFSKAKGGKPVDKNIRGLAWVVLKWAAKVRPRVIMLENVEEFVTWGPVRKGRPVKSKKGQTFRLWKSQLESLGYKVEHRELVACDYGAPTSRKRFFLIARRDGRPIVWPEPTHGDPDGLMIRCGLLKPWRAAAECIDWSIPCPSIFESAAEIKAKYGIRVKRPLAKNTLRRIARGIMKFVINNPEPFIVRICQSGFGGDGMQYSIHQPLTTIVTKAEHCLVTPFLAQKNDVVRGQELTQPIMTLDTSNRYALIAPFLTKPTSSWHAGEVRAFLLTYYGNSDDIGQSLNEPLRTITSKDRFGLVTVAGQDYRIVDIGMRMLTPRELFLCQGFPEDYIIDRDYVGDQYPKEEQVARCGNAVPPQFSEALVRANLPELCQQEEVRSLSC